MRYLSKLTLVFLFGTVGLFAQAPDAVEDQELNKSEASNIAYRRLAVKIEDEQKLKFLKDSLGITILRESDTSNMVNIEILARNVSYLREKGLDYNDISPKVTMIRKNLEAKKLRGIQLGVYKFLEKDGDSYWDSQGQVDPSGDYGEYPGQGIVLGYDFLSAGSVEYYFDLSPNDISKLLNYHEIGALTLGYFGYNTSGNGPNILVDQGGWEYENWELFSEDVDGSTEGSHTAILGDETWIRDHMDLGDEVMLVKYDGEARDCVWMKYVQAIFHIADTIPYQPSTPSGPDAAEINEAVEFSSSITDPESDDVKAIFHWGDGDSTITSFKSSGSTFRASHSYSQAGTYEIWVSAYDEFQDPSAAVYCWSSISSVDVYAVPDIAVDPPSWNYGNVAVEDETEDKIFEVINEGTGTLHVSSSSITGSDPEDFSIISGSGSFTLSPGSSHDIKVRFDPNSRNGKSAKLRIQSDDPDDNPKYVNLSGTGLAPHIDVDPPSGDYKEVPVGNSSDIVFEVSNEGNADLFATDVDIIGGDQDYFGIVSGPNMFNLSPGDNVEITVRFTPENTDYLDDAIMRIRSNDPDDDPKDVPLEGKGVEGPHLHLSRTNWSSPSEGETSPSIGVTNTGTGGEIDYNISTDSVWLNPSSSSGTTPGNFTITADGNTTGSIRTGYVVVEATESGVENSPDTVTVTQPSADTPYLSVLPDSWSAPSIGGPSSSIEVTNTGGGGSIDYNISTDSVWLNPSSSSGTTPGNFTITADGNTTGSIRTGYVVVEATEGGVENSPDTVTVTQSSGDSPHILVSPDSLSDSLLAGETSVRTLTVYNTGSGNLTINISTWERLLALLKSNKTTTDKVSLSSQFEYLEVGKNEIDPRQGNPVVLGAGGPDSFGYTWIDSDEGGSCNFEWVDITSTGTQVTGLSDDDFAGPYSISFEFPFYDSVYTEFYVSSNGFIGFGPTSSYSVLNNQPIPTTNSPNNIIAWCWDDLYPRGSVYYEDFGDRLVVQFVDYGEYGEDGRINAEVIIHQSGGINIQYLNSYDGFDLSSSTIGIENITGTDGLEVAFNTDYIHDSLAVKLFRGATWLSVDPVSDTISSGSSVDIEVTFDATGLYDGDYYSDIIISSNDPETSEFPVPAHLHVTGVPGIVISEDTLDYGIVFTGCSYYDTLIVEYTGTNSLTVSDISSDNLDFIADTTNFTLNPGEEQEVVVTFIPSSLGTITGNLTVASDDPNSPSMIVFLQGECVEPPDISVSPDSLIETLSPGENSTDTLTIYNTGINDLVFDILISPEWLSVDPISDTISSGDSTLSEVTFNATGLNDGNYFDYITVSSNDPDEPELIIPVYLNILSGGIEEKKIPESFFVKQNYPNPFGYQTVISYGCPKKAKVCIQVFDCSGRIVQTLIDKEVEAGYHEVKWEGTNEFGKKLSNAIYFYRIQAGNFIKTKKMIFIQ